MIRDRTCQNTFVRSLFSAKHRNLVQHHLGSMQIFEFDGEDIANVRRAQRILLANLCKELRSDGIERVLVRLEPSAVSVWQ